MFRDLFIREGFQFDYVFDWTILKFQQLQTANAPPHVLGSRSGPSNGRAPADPNTEKQSGGEEARMSGLSATDPSRRRFSSLAVSAGSTKQRNPVGIDLPAMKDAMPDHECMSHVVTHFSFIGALKRFFKTTCCFQ